VSAKSKLWDRGDLTRVAGVAGESSQAGLDGMQGRKGDASDLEGADDDSLDLILSMFSAVSATKGPDQASQMVRVRKTGGRDCRARTKSLKNGRRQ
jgi:ubiquinone/menaquinone biosynthesis C-methylase UbiE